MIALLSVGRPWWLHAASRRQPHQHGARTPRTTAAAAATTFRRLVLQTATRYPQQLLPTLTLLLLPRTLQYPRQHASVHGGLFRKPASCVSAAMPLLALILATSSSTWTSRRNLLCMSCPWDPSQPEDADTTVGCCTVSRTEQPRRNGQGRRILTGPQLNVWPTPAPCPCCTAHLAYLGPSGGRMMSVASTILL